MIGYTAMGHAVALLLLLERDYAWEWIATASVTVRWRGWPQAAPPAELDQQLEGRPSRSHPWAAPLGHPRACIGVMYTMCYVP